MKRDTGAHWRDSGRVPRLFWIDARACFPIVILLFHFRIWTLLLAISVIIFFSVLERFHLTFMVFLRVLREFITGKKKQRIKRL